MQLGSFSQQGVSLYLTIVILSLLTAGLLALLAVSLSQTRSIAALTDSVLAFYAADTGIERVLFKLYKSDPAWVPIAGDKGKVVYPDICFGQLCDNCLLSQWDSVPDGGEAKYKVCIHPDDETKIQSVGDFRGTERKIEINFP